MRLGVHEHPMPALQHDRPVLRMRDAAPCVELGVAAHNLSAPGASPGMPTHEVLVLLFGQSTAECRLGLNEAPIPPGGPRDIDPLPAETDGLLSHVGVAPRRSRYGLVVKDVPLLDLEVGGGDEEPLALAHIGGVAAPVVKPLR